MKDITKFIFAITLLFNSIVVSAQTNIVINPNNKYQTIEGWGGSLCWWAVVTGGFSESKVDTISKWITSPNELNMNVFRYNIGGGENPAHDHMRPGGEVPGFKASGTASYDWTQDANQRKMLLKLNALRKDIINEAFSNSPPYWMTKSTCASGNTDGSDNLRDDQYKAFADYLTEVVKFYKEKHNITFATLDPFNEPFSNWWKQNNNQEGCRFSQANQQKMILELHAVLSSKKMLEYTAISAMDANSLDEAVNGIIGYERAGNIMSKIIQINAHSYAGSKRKELAQLAAKHNKPLWQSESGPLGTSLTGMDNYLFMAKRLIADLRDLKPVVWADWQLTANNEPSWSLIDANYSTQAIKKNKSYYIRMQCSRFIKQGYTIIESNQANTVAALNSLGNELVVVICNDANAIHSSTLDLSAFTNATSSQLYRTSANENCAKIQGPAVNNKMLNYSVPAKSISTLVIPVSLPITSTEYDANLSIPNIACTFNSLTQGFTIAANTHYHYSVVDLNGKLIEEGKVAEGNLNIGYEWNSGLYILKVKSKNETRLF